MVEVSTSILTANDIKTIYDLEVAKTDYLHIDVMDGEFVKNDTTVKMMQYASTIKNVTNLPLDVHLMVNDVESYIAAYSDLEPNIITFHYESNKDKDIIMQRINKIKNSNIKVGISIKPNTPINEIFEFLQYIHLVLIMTVEPGEGGQKIIIETIEKVKDLKEYIKRNNIDIDIEADGGINTENVDMLKKAGADIIVSGSAILNSNNYTDIIKKLKE